MRTLVNIISLAFFILIIPYPVSAQEVDMDFGKFSEEELSARVYEKDSSASAVILGDFGYCDFTYNDVGGLQFNFTRRTSGNFLMATLGLDETGALSGTVTASRKCHMAMLERKKIHEKQVSNNKQEEDLASEPNQWEIRNYEITGLENPGEPLKENYEVTLKDYYQAAGNLIYLNPIITGRMETNPFKLETRKFPVDLPYQFNDTYMLNFTIPEGYEIDEQPENIAVALPNEAGVYYYTIKQRGNLLQVTSKVDIKKRKFMAEDYPYLKEFFGMMVAKTAEQIVLKKN